MKLLPALLWKIGLFCHRAVPPTDEALGTRKVAKYADRFEKRSCSPRATWLISTSKARDQAEQFRKRESGDPKKAIVPCDSWLAAAAVPQRVNLQMKGTCIVRCQLVQSQGSEEKTTQQSL